MITTKRIKKDELGRILYHVFLDGRQVGTVQSTWRTEWVRYPGRRYGRRLKPYRIFCINGNHRHWRRTLKEAAAEAAQQ